MPLARFEPADLRLRPRDHQDVIAKMYCRYSWYPVACASVLCRIMYVTEMQLPIKSYSENPNKMQQFIKMLLFLILNEAQHVSGDTPPIIGSLKLHKQPLVLHTWKVVGRAVVGRCQIAYATWQRPTTFHVYKTRGWLCSFRLLMMGSVSPETCCPSFKRRNDNILIHRCILLGVFTVRNVLWCTDPRTWTFPVIECKYCIE